MFKIDKRLLPYVLCFALSFLTNGSVMAQSEWTNTSKQYHERISQLWNARKMQYSDMIGKSGENPQVLYEIQAETNNLLKYAGYCKQYMLLDELIGLYLQALNTLISTDQYLYAYYSGGSRRSVHTLDKKYRMWVDKQKPIGEESILTSAQFLYVLSDTISLIADISKEKRTPIMKEALNKFAPLLVEHYKRWVLNTPGPFQVRGWGCRFDGKHVPTGMNHFEFVNKKLDKKLGNGDSLLYCNAVTDMDLWIIAGVTNVLSVYQKEKTAVPITPEEFGKLLNYVKTGVKLLESRFSYTSLKDFEGKPVIGAVFDAGVWDEHPDFAYAGYGEQEVLKIIPADKSKYRGKGTGWDLSHARRHVHVFETLFNSRDALGLDFPTKELLGKMSNQLIYATFNRDMKKPLFTNFVDGTNGWYRMGYSNRAGFGYGPWDMSIAVLTGGYGFWSRYNQDINKLFTSLFNMIESNDQGIRKHVNEHYEMNIWNQFKRTRAIDFKNSAHQGTQSVLIQFLPSLCFITTIGAQP
jgi:hypothetical protein